MVLRAIVAIMRMSMFIDPMPPIAREFQPRSLLLLLRHSINADSFHRMVLWSLICRVIFAAIKLSAIWGGGAELRLPLYFTVISICL